MRLDNEFVVPRPVDEAWAVLTDVERIAPCMPGATLTEVVDDAYRGTVKVKVGPVVAQYGGVARFTELDAERHHAVLEARGKERTGRGLASAVVTADLAPEGDGTRVTVGTELTISGPLAQFGRGAIAEVSGRLISQFVERLKETVLDDQTRQPPVPTTRAQATRAQATEEPATEEPNGAQTGGRAEGQAGPAAARPDPVGAATEPAAPGQAPTQPPAQASTAPADLLRVAAVPILKRLLPVLILIVVVIVVLVVWLD